jgi:hypothetical protein
MSWKLNSLPFWIKLLSNRPSQISINRYHEQNISDHFPVTLAVDVSVER